MAKTLLVTDDAAIIREKIKEAARSAGWEIAGEARNGKEAVERYAEFRPTAMTVDLVMPEYDGIYALREILALDPNAKVIVVSALGQKNVLKDAFKLGAADFVVKPFDKHALTNTLEQFAIAEASAAGAAPPEAANSTPPRGRGLGGRAGCESDAAIFPSVKAAAHPCGKSRARIGKRKTRWVSEPSLRSCFLSYPGTSLVFRMKGLQARCLGQPLRRPQER